MPSSTGSSLSIVLQRQVDRLSAACVTCDIAGREDAWYRGAAFIRANGGESSDLDDAIQDAGFRLGIYSANAQTCRFYSWPLAADLVGRLDY